MTTAAVAASVAFTLGVWLTVAVMSMATRRLTHTEIHTNRQLSPSDEDATGDLCPSPQ